jgi:hypothetical protein
VENSILIAPLEHEAVRDYIPGRSTNDVEHGAAPANRNTTTGATNNNTAR